MKIFIKLLCVISLWLFSSYGYGQENEELFEPEPFGGVKAMQYFFEREMIYPEALLAQKTKGSVTLSFKVASTGLVEDLKVLATTDERFNEEALRLFKLIMWKPAVNLMNKPHEKAHNLVISFNPSAYQRAVKKRGYTLPPIWPNNWEKDYKVYTSVEEVATAGNSMFWLNTFLKENLKYPPEAFNRSISGTVLLKMVVEPNGLASNIQILNSVGGGCDEEALRLLWLIRWNPAKLNGKPVRSFTELPITFNL